MELAVLLLAFFSQQLTENTSFAIRANNLITNIGIIFIPFLVMTGFLYYEVSIFRKENNPQNNTLYATKNLLTSSGEDSIVLVVID